MLAYEELKGSNGKEIWFRPTRFDARKLFPNNPPRVRVKSSSYQLHNISLTGIAVVAKQATDEELTLGETVPIIFQQAGLSIFEGRAKVCRTETTPFGSKYAFSLVNSYVDFDRLLSRNVQAQIAANGSFLSSERNALVPREYRAFCSDVLGVLRSYRALLDEKSSASLPTSPIPSTMSAPMKRARGGSSSNGAVSGSPATTSCAK